MIKATDDFYVNKLREVVTNTLSTKELSTHGFASLSRGDGESAFIPDGAYLLVVAVDAEDHDLVERYVASLVDMLHSNFAFGQSATKTRVTFDIRTPAFAESGDEPIPF
jgi:hypothetical protein